jgi:hypothetical protein
VTTTDDLLRRIDGRLNIVEKAVAHSVAVLSFNMQQQEQMMAAIDDLKAKWGELRTEVGDAVTAIADLQARLEANAGNEAMVASIAAEMGTVRDRLDAAFVTAEEAAAEEGGQVARP